MLGFTLCWNKNTRIKSHKMRDLGNKTNEGVSTSSQLRWRWRWTSKVCEMYMSFASSPHVFHGLSPDEQDQIYVGLNILYDPRVYNILSHGVRSKRMEDMYGVDREFKSRSYWLDVLALNIHLWGLPNPRSTGSYNNGQWLAIKMQFNDPIRY